MLPRSGNKSFNGGVFIPVKMRFYNKCNDKNFCDECNNQDNENKKLEADINPLK